MEPIARTPADYETFRIKASDTNRMAIIADPVRDRVPFVAIVEIFDPGGATPPNTHADAYEMFHVLKGTGEARVGEKVYPLTPGDSLILPPGNEHVVTATGGERLYCLTVMIPNEGFAELIRSGLPEPLDALDRAVLARTSA